MEEITKEICIKAFRNINNNQELDEKNITLTKSSGISNSIFKVEYCENNEDVNNDQMRLGLKTRTFLFRWFGKISFIVNRELEMIIINGLNKRSLGPSIIETDYTTYRIEEYLEDTRNIRNDELLDEFVISQIYTIFMNFYEIDDSHYYRNIGAITQNKSELYETLLNHQIPNLFNFSIKLRKIAYESLDTFLNQFIEDKNYWIDRDQNDSSIVKYEDIVVNSYKLKEILDKSIELLIEILPSTPLFVLSHNDAHPGNILIQDRKVYLIDHEYACYNYLGFEIANFLLETIFTLDWYEFPYYKQFESFDIFYEEKYFGLYKQFINMYFDKYDHELKGIYSNYNKVKEDYLSLKTYINLIRASSIYWTIYSIYYIDYTGFKNKSCFDYFNYSLTRFSVYDYFENIK